MSIGDFPESSSQAMSVGTTLVGGLGVTIQVIRLDRPAAETRRDAWAGRRARRTPVLHQGWCSENGARKMFRTMFRMHGLPCCHVLNHVIIVVTCYNRLPVGTVRPDSAACSAACRRFALRNLLPGACHDYIAIIIYYWYYCHSNYYYYWHYWYYYYYF